MWKKFEINSIKKIVLVRKGRRFYATLYQEVFFCNPGRGRSLTAPSFWTLGFRTGAC